MKRVLLILIVALLMACSEIEVNPKVNPEDSVDPTCLCNPDDGGSN